MKKILTVCLFTLLFMGVVFGQNRQPQFEVFGGLALPMSPDFYKDYHKMGFSPNVQYVFFPSDRLGISVGGGYEIFTFDKDKYLEDLFGGADISVSGSLSILELGVGVRPYLTSAEASTQIFLFGMGTYNFLNAKYEVEGIEIKGDENKAGVGFGGGMEIPAGEKYNLILQGVYRIIFTEEESVQFLGITVGLVF